MTRQSSYLARALFAAAMAAGSAMTTQAQTATAGDTEARQIFALTNQDRAERGLPALRWSTALARSAEAHAEIMAQEPELAHQYSGEPELT